MKRRILNLLISIDQLVHVIITLGAADPDETLSSSAYRQWKDKKFFGFFKYIIDFLFLPIEKDHCYKSYTSMKNKNNV